MRVAIFGAGPFGQGLFHVLDQAGHDVLMYIRNMEQSAKAAELFGADKVTNLLPNPPDFDHVFITTPASSVSGLLDSIDGEHPNTNLFLVQKGALPKSVFKNSGWQGTYYLTGAAVSDDLMNGGIVGMILASWAISPSVADLIRSIASFRAVWWDNPFDVFYMNQLRTISSIQHGIADAMLPDQPSTLALVNSSIEAEGRDIAEKVGHSNLVSNTSARAIRVRRILDADQKLCATRQSRNYEFGARVGQGWMSRELQLVIESARGVVEGINNTYLLYEQLRLCTRLKDFPYLYHAKRVMEGSMTIEKARCLLEERRDGWL